MVNNLSADFGENLMLVEWKFGVPENLSYNLSEVYVVYTSYGNLNTGMYSSKINDWFCFGVLGDDEKVLAYLDGLTITDALVEAAYGKSE